MTNEEVNEKMRASMRAIEQQIDVRKHAIIMVVYDNDTGLIHASHNMEEDSISEVLRAAANEIDESLTDTEFASFVQ